MVTVRVHMYLLARFPLSPLLEGLLCVRMRMCWLVTHRRYLRLCILTPHGYVRGGILCECMRVCWLVTLLRSPTSSHVDDNPCRNLYSL